MFFLMNNYVLNLEEDDEPPEEIRCHFPLLKLDHMSRLGAELFAAQPILPITSPGKAKRLAMLIRGKQPQINGALFVAPTLHPKPEDISVRYADLCIETLAMLNDRQRGGMLTTIVADQMVWRRLAS